MKLLLIVALCASAALAQQATGTLRGQVFDELGGAIVGATVVAVDATGKEKTTTTNDQGQFVINGLTPGKYTVRASTTGFAPYENADVSVTAGRGQPLNITLKVTIEEQKVTVAIDSQALSTEPENNAGAIVLKGSDLEALPDDPDDLAAALQALAGPSAGPNGGQIFIDGFSNGTLPPKSAIREIRINQNPFSSEYDRPGFGRVEVFTKPGTDKWHGQGMFNENNSVFNSRNPYIHSNIPDYHSEIYNGNVGGSLGKTMSAFVNAERRNINETSAIAATELDANGDANPFTQAVLAPRTRTNFSPRLDWQITPGNTLTTRYQFVKNDELNQGIGGITLASRAYSNAQTQHQVQVSDTQVLSAHLINET